MLFTIYSTNYDTLTILTAESFQNTSIEILHPFTIQSPVTFCHAFQKFTNHSIVTLFHSDVIQYY